ncbi:MAG: hypothetical protein WC330_07935 [Candidatus Omnitrophota bacterium]
MRLILALIIFLSFSSGCAGVWKKITNPFNRVKDCNDICDPYGNCERICK